MYVAVFLIFVIATVVVALTAGGSGAVLEPEVIEPTIKIKPGDPIAPRNSEVKLGDDYVVIGYNDKDESIYFTSTTEVVVGDATKGYSNPMTLIGAISYWISQMLNGN